MRILITGAAGMLGTDLLSLLDSHDVTALDRASLDVTDPSQVDAAVAGQDAVINCAAYTRVDDAESDAERADAVNATAAGLLAAAAAREGARLIQVSTDYVFDGRATTPYSEDAATSPLSVYGRTKLRGEQLALAANPATWVLRTAWLYGHHGANFITAILRQAGLRDQIPVVTNNMGAPTWTMDVSRQIIAVLEAQPEPGIYHATNSGETSRYDFAREIMRLAGLDPDRIQPVTSVDDRPAARPEYSVLGHDRWRAVGIEPLRPWQAALADYFAAAD